LILPAALDIAGSGAACRVGCGAVVCRRGDHASPRGERATIAVDLVYLAMAAIIRPLLAPVTALLPITTWREV